MSCMSRAGPGSGYYKIMARGTTHHATAAPAGRQLAILSRVPAAAYTFFNDALLISFLCVSLPVCASLSRHGNCAFVHIFDAYVL